MGPHARGAGHAARRVGRGPGRGWSPDVSGRVEAACVLTHVEPAMRQDAWVVVLGRGWSPDVSGRVEAACVLTHVEPAMRQDAWERKRERGGGRAKENKCASSHGPV